VRAYDLLRRRLMPAPVIDPREPDEKMQGLPMTRTVSADGRWAYTLYARPEEAPFIHALDTERRTAACIDLDELTMEDVGDARLALTGGGGTLRVDGSVGPLAVVNTRTFAVTRPAAQAAPARRAVSSRDDGGGVPWVVAFVALVPLAGLGVVVARRRRHARSTPA
jgi:MYXO-CTERM domain-containing protein